MLVFTQDKKRLLEFFKKDPVLFAYHIGDLDDFFFNDCQWAVTYGYLPYIEEVILLYTGLKTPTVLAFGVGPGFPDLLREMIDILPETFHCHFQSTSRNIFLEHFDEHPLGTHWKMKLEHFTPTGRQTGAGKIIRLDRSHELELLALYEKSYPDNYFVSRMLDTGKYFGYVEDNRIVAVAGVHVDSDKFGVATLGNITTHPDFRGRGLGTIVTSHMTAKLVSEGKIVCLNVKADNVPAITCYQNLGFVKVHQHEEALFTWKKQRA